MSRLNQEVYSSRAKTDGSLWDVVGVLGYLLLVGLIVATGPVYGPLRLVAVAPLFAVLPGYALLSLLFPAHSDSRFEVENAPRAVHGVRGLGWRDRLLLSFGTSVALMPIFGFVVAAAGGIRPGIAVAVMGAFVLVGMLFGAVRRWRLPPDQTYRVPVSFWREGLESAVFDVPDRREAVLNIVLIVVVLGAVLGLAAAVAAPPAAERYTGLSLLTVSETGAYVEAGYPSTFVAGQPQSLVAAVTNHEKASMEYSIVIEVHRLSDDADSATVLERSELSRERARVEPGETWYWDHEVATQMLGEDLRLTYLLYQGSAPASPSMDSAYRTAFLWISITQAESDT